MNNKHDCPERSDSDKKTSGSGGWSSSLQTKQHQDTETSHTHKHSHTADENADRWTMMLEIWFIRQFSKATFLDVTGIFASVVLIVVGIVAACIYDGQLEEMRHTNQLTQNTLDYTKTQNAAQAVVDAAARIKSDKRADDSFRATIDNFHQEQRAWIGDAGAALALPYNSAHLAMQIKIMNTGKTPGNVDSVDFSVRSSKFPFTTSTELQPVKHLGGGAAPPNSPRDMDILEDKPITDNDFQLMQRETLRHEFHVTVRYKDAFGFPHTTKICEALIGIAPKMMPPYHFPSCPTNEMN